MIRTSTTGILKFDDSDDPKFHNINFKTNKKYNPMEPWLSFTSNYETGFSLRRNQIYVSEKDVKNVYWNNRGQALNKFTLNNTYHKSLALIFMSTTKCGITLPMLERKDLLGTILRYHVCLKMEKFNKTLNINHLTKFDINYIQSNIPEIFSYYDGNIPKDYKQYYKNGKCKPVSDLHKFWQRKHPDGVMELRTDDYQKFIPTTSNGITKYGLVSITESIMVLIYNMLLAQGKTAYPIQSNMQSGVVGITQNFFRNHHNTGLLAGDNTQLVMDTTESLKLIAQQTTVWLDICEGMVSVPTNLIVFKMFPDQRGSSGLVSKMVVGVQSSEEPKQKFINYLKGGEVYQELSTEIKFKIQKLRDQKYTQQMSEIEDKIRKYYELNTNPNKEQLEKYVANLRKEKTKELEEYETQLIFSQYATEKVNVNDEEDELTEPDTKSDTEDEFTDDELTDVTDIDAKDELTDISDLSDDEDETTLSDTVLKITPVILIGAVVAKRCLFK